MPCALAYADTTDPTQTNFLILLLCILLIGCVCGMAFLVLLLARSRRHRRVEYLTVLTIFWAFLTAASLAYSAVTRLDWSQENALRLETGYGNPDDNPPQLPWKTWVALAAAWGGLITWSLNDGAKN